MIRKGRPNPVGFHFLVMIIGFAVTFCVVVFGGIAIGIAGFIFLVLEKLLGSWELALALMLGAPLLFYVLGRITLVVYDKVEERKESATQRRINERYG